MRFAIWIPVISSRGAWMRVSGNGSLMPREPRSCRAFWMGYGVVRNKCSGNYNFVLNYICNLDPCHKFTWCLDACIRERFIDAKRAKELQGFLDGIRRGQEQVLG